MIVLRLAAIILVFVAFIIVVADGAVSIAAGKILLMPLGDVLSAVGVVAADWPTQGRILSAILALPASPIVLSLAFACVAGDTLVKVLVAKVLHSMGRYAS